MAKPVSISAQKLSAAAKDSVAKALERHNAALPINPDVRVFASDIFRRIGSSDSSSTPNSLKNPRSGMRRPWRAMFIMASPGPWPPLHPASPLWCLAADTLSAVSSRRPKLI
jgi:hypothetical protein